MSGSRISELVSAPLPLVGSEQTVLRSGVNNYKVAVDEIAARSVAGSYAAPLVHDHSADAITSGTITFARLPVAGSGISSSSLLVRADDSRLSDSRSPTAHSHSISDITGLQTILDSKASSIHGHLMSDIEGLSDALAGKANSVHGHSISAITDLQSILDSKASSIHSHTIGNITGLQTALDGKAPSSHDHSISNITGLQTALDSKASSIHSHAISDITNLQGALNGKALLNHSHVSADIIDFASSVNSRISDYLTPGSYITLTYDAGTNKLIVASTNSGDTGDVPEAPFDSVAYVRINTNWVAGSSFYALTSHNHSGSHITSGTIGIDRLPVGDNGVSDSTTVVRANDSRLSNARTPISHSHPISDITNLQTSLDSKASTLHGHTISDVSGLQTALDSRATIGHAHVIGDIANLSWTLDSKANASHVHLIADVTGLQTALDNKSSIGHSHAISDVTDLQSTLDGKASSIHTHAISDVTGLQTALNGKSSTGHNHEIADVTGLQTALDGKSGTGHSHEIADVTGLQTALNGKVGTTDTQTLTNKRISPRIVSVSTAATITPTGDTADQYNVTALSSAATVAAPSGTPTDGQRLILRFEDNGVSRSLTWTTSLGAYRAVGASLPTTTTATKVTYVGCIYNAQDGYWDVIAVVTQA